MSVDGSTILLKLLQWQVIVRGLSDRSERSRRNECTFANFRTLFVRSIIFRFPVQFSEEGKYVIFSSSFLYRTICISTRSQTVKLKICKDDLYA